MSQIDTRARPYSYYDTPDGEDYFKKQYYLLRPAILFGGFWAAHDILQISRPIGFIPTIDRFFRVFSKPIIAVLLFETTVYCTTKLRKKDNAWNHVLGGAVVTRYFASIVPYTPTAYFLGFLGCFALAQFKFFKQEYGNVYWWNSYTLREELCTSAWANYESGYSFFDKIPRGWLRADEVEQKENKDIQL